MPKGGSIIQISSATATIMLNDHAAYMGTKAGTDHVVRCVANEFGAQGHSRQFDLAGTDRHADDGGRQGDARRCSTRSCRAIHWAASAHRTDIAAAAVWLASDECFMTGENLQVNGGLTLRMNPTKQDMAESIAKATGKA